MSELDIEKVGQFSEDYKRICFQFWYGSGCLSATSLVELPEFPVDKLGHRATAASIRHWMKKYAWKILADELDAKAHLLADADLISSKARMLKKQAENAVKIQERALAHMLTDDFDSSAAAVQAYFRATEEERKALGIGELLERIRDMNDEQLQRRILELASRAGQSAPLVIDAEEVDTESSQTEE